MIRRLINPHIKWFPLWEDLKNYRWGFLRYDILSSFSLAFVSIPQTVAYAIVAGIPWESSLVSIVVGTFIAAIFGSSRFLISGPTTSGAVLIKTILIGTLTVYFPNLEGEAKNALILSILAGIVLIVGLSQLLVGLFKVGKILEFISRPVLLGYFLGLTFSMVSDQLHHFFGIENMPITNMMIYNIFHLIANIGSTNLTALTLGMVTLIGLFGLSRFGPKVPATLIVLIFMTAVSSFLESNFNMNIPYLEKIQSEGGKFNFSLMLPHLDFTVLSHIFSSISAMTFLIILTIFSTTKNMSVISGEEINAQQEIYGTGISNVCLSFFPFSMPVMSSFSRSLLSFYSHSKSRLAAIFSSLVLVFIIYFLWSFIGKIPLTCLAALILFMSKGVVKKDPIKVCLQAGRGDFLSFALTFLACFFFRLDVAFFIGVGISIIYYIKHSSCLRFVEYVFDTGGHLVLDTNRSGNIRIINVQGELFFAVVEIFQKTIENIAKGHMTKIIIVRLGNVRYIDASMCFSILQMKEYLHSKGIVFILSGVTKEAYNVLSRTGIDVRIGKNNIFLCEEEDPYKSTWRAYLYAEDRLVNSG